jgi:glucan biosynthesis protein C
MSQEVCDKPGRLHFADNMRWSMIVLVIFVHSSVTYGTLGSWFYRDRVGATDTTDLVLNIFGVFIQAFFMGLLFFLAGYFVPGSLQRKGRTKFLRDRVIRLGVPALLFMFLIAPPLDYFANQDYWHGHGISTFGDWLRNYLPDPWKWDSGPLWFTIALLMLTFAWLLYGSLMKDRWQLQKFELKQRHLVLLMLLMGVTSFIVRLQYPIGTDVWNMQLCFFPQYVTLFAFGILAYRNGWLTSISRKMARPWKFFWLLLVLVLFPVLVVAGGALDDGTDSYFGGLHWQSFAFSLWIEAYCVAILVTLVVAYRERFNWQGRISKFLSDNSFAVYVFHAPVVVGVAVALSSLNLPVLLKFLMLAFGSLLITFLLAAYVVRKTPLLKNLF